MHYRINYRREGFTLVELSIVLVIVGLLIGGILAAQSMISTAKVNSAAMQIGQFDAMVENFKIKYNTLPGDATSFGGNGNGILTQINGADVDIFGGEIGYFWYDMDQQTYSKGIEYGGGFQAVTTGIGKNVPLSKLGKSGSFFMASGVTSSTCCDHSTTIAGTNFYVIMDPTQAQTATPYYAFNDTTSANSTVKPADLLALDKKIDDGIANSGNVMSGELTYSDPNYVSALATCSSGATYQVQNSTYECTPLIRIGASTGDPQ